ncbi:MAG: T9SS type A sorting domain-containing protein, partial [Ignavibacteriaceae bacterium]
VTFCECPSANSIGAIKSPIINGNIEFVGGGFDGWSGLRFGLFYSDSAGVVDSTADGPMWSGSEAYSTGYLFCPNSGTNDNPTWSGSGGNGSVGGVVNATWLSTNGANNYILSDQKTTNVSGAGTYDFKLTFKDMGSQGTAVGYSISGPSYLLEGHAMDTSSSRPTKFNAINFAVSGGNLSTTGLDITDVLVDVGSPVITGVSDEKNSTLPMTFSLSQNYPNPFNPTTTIKFGLPKAADVSLVVYDILGRKVTELVHGNLTAGYHTVNFNASNLASGVYFYRIQAGDFVSVKKLMLLK